MNIIKANWTLSRVVNSMKNIGVDKPVAHELDIVVEIMQEVQHFAVCEASRPNDPDHATRLIEAIKRHAK